MIIPVNASEQSYDIVIERGALNRAGELLNLKRKVLVVTDDGVPKEYALSVAAKCQEPTVVTVAHGEESKCFKEFGRLLSVMLNNSFTRGDCVVAVGGGVVGDLSGFAASCYMRGIDFYNIPTTLLSQVDSSIGGKTAIDYEGFKNAVGAFYQPKKVIIDPDTLKTLDTRQLHAGLAEAIKMSLTSDKGLFELIEKSEKLEDDLPEIIKNSIAIKKDVVEKDPKEGGLRRVLNFGHTVGHAIESFNAGRLLHGECVAAGMLPFCSDEVRERLIPVLEKYNLPSKIEQKPDELMRYIMHDKKMSKNGVTAVLVNEIGSFVFKELAPSEITEYLERLV